MNVESAKKNPLIATLDVPPQAGTSKTGGTSDKKSLDLDYAPPTTGGSSAVSFFKASTAPSLEGTGVSSQVFGPVSPNVGAMSAPALAANIAKLGKAMRANVGKLNDADIQLYGAMTKQLAGKLVGGLDLSRSPKTMDNRALHASLLALDMQQATGVPLTKAQAEFQAKAQAEWKERAKHDPQKLLSELEARREKLAHDTKIACATTFAAGVGAAGHMPLISAGATAVATGHAIHEGKYFDAAFELATFAGGLVFGPGVEAIAVGKGALECGLGIGELHALDKQIETHKAALPKK